MIIQKLEIDNFRSYYKSNKFEFGNRLNLIIGANGDGKTTLYEAIEWLFRTDGTNKMDEKFISKKRAAEIMPDESDDVRVAMTYEHKGKMKTLEKMFHFTKSFDDSISLSNFSYTLTEESGVERISKNGIEFDHDLPSEIRKYTMFKGESDLDVFQQSNALKMLVDTFSDVKDFEAYFDFMKKSSDLADKARDNMQQKDRRNQDKIKGYRNTIENENRLIYDIEREIREKENESVNFDKLLKDIEQSKEASQLLISVNRRIANLEEKRDEVKVRIKENYTIDLLDKMWILMGFEDIANEYSNKVNEFDRKRRKLENDYMQSVGAEKLIQKIQKEHSFVPLPAHIPGRKIMEEMLEEEVCKICGRPAKKHSDPWNFMMQRLEEYKLSLTVDSEDEDIPPFYRNSYIPELQKRDTTLNDNLAQITKLRHQIQEIIALNNRLRNDVKKYEANIAREFESKKRILSHSDGLTEDQLTASYQSITQWVEKKNNAERRLETLRRMLKEHEEAREEAQKSLSKLAEGTTAEVFARAATMIRHISEAFRNAKDANKKRLLHTIEDEANVFLAKLNTNDFKGTIRIIEKGNGQGEAVLVSDDNSRIYNANTALKTTYLMSVLFAIGQISSQRNETEFPLLFDAPTSSFTDTKENEFFDVIGKLDKQVIIVTKSFLKDSANGDSILDRSKVNEVNGVVYRIEKKKPFNDKKLDTIQTIISKIK